MQSLAQAHSIEDLRVLAKRRLPQGVFDFFDGGAEDEVTLKANRTAFERVRIVPRVLVDVHRPELETEILGLPSSAPLVIAPTGGIGAGWPQGDLLIARAARRAGIPYTLSTAATSSIEAIAEVGGRLWFQLYVLRDSAFTDHLIERAKACGYEALVVTVDLATGGKRERDLRNRFTVPLRPGPRMIGSFAVHPAWWWRMLRHGTPRFENLTLLRGISSPATPIAVKIAQNLDASFDWTALQALRERWRGKLIVKGVAHPDDAARIAGLGVDAVWISNHGGRQLDGGVASLEALREIVHSLEGRAAVLLDSGIRRGVDILKARALGAQAVGIGRATLYGVAAAGEAGADRALQILTDELRRAMQLSGVRRVADINQGLLAHWKSE